MQVRCVNGYGPQENSAAEKKEKFWAHLEHEVDDAMDDEKALILQMDRNLHVGDKIIEGEPNPCNNNG